MRSGEGYNGELYRDGWEGVIEGFDGELEQLREKGK